MTAVPEEQMPFRVSFDPERGQLVLMMTFGVQPRQRVTSELILSAEAAAVQIALNRHEARMRAHLADAIAEATTRFRGRILIGWRLRWPRCRTRRRRCRSVRSSGWTGRRRTRARWGHQGPDLHFYREKSCTPPRMQLK